MSKSITIAGVERADDLERDTLEITPALTYELDTCTFNISGTKPDQGDEVIIEGNGHRFFGGIVKKVELLRTFPDKTIKVWRVDCDDYTDLVDRKLVVESYSNTSASAIFADIAAKYCPGFTAVGVRTGAPTVEQLVFEYKRPSECFRELCEYVGWHWQPDYYKDLQFFSTADLATEAPLELVPGAKFDQLKHVIDTQDLRNRVYVRGGNMLSDPFPHKVVADGQTRVWVLPHKPSELTMTVNEVPVTVGIENVHKDADYNYMLNYQEKYIRASKQTATITQGVTIEWNYKHNIPVITVVEDFDSQAAVAAVQGGDGVYEHSITDDTLVTLDAAEAAGNADLREHGNPKVTGSFTTEIPGWAPGQFLTISLADRGVTGTYLVRRLSIAPAAASLWTYKVEYGGRLLSIADVLQALVSAQQQKDIAETILLQKFAYGPETVTITDVMTPATHAPTTYVGEAGAECGFAQVDGFFQICAADGLGIDSGYEK